MKHLAFILLLLPSFIWAQEKKGVYFEHELSWAGVKEKAKKENKYIFLDCYTTWCGPCKYMSQTVFPQEKVGAFFNKHYINAKVQLDTTDRDSEAVKSWYADGTAIAKQYNVRAYPTFLIFSPQGELVHRIVGGDEADNFIAKAEKSLHTENQYYTQLKKYEAGEKSPEFLKNLSLLAMEAYEEEAAKKIASQYFTTQDNLFTKENLMLLSQFARDSKSKGFEIMLNEGAKVDAILGEGAAAKMVLPIIMQEEVYAGISRSKQPNLDSLKQVVQAKYPTVELAEPFALLNVQLLQGNQDWANFQPAVLDYMKKYGAKVSADYLNSFAWTVFENCKDKDCVSEALAWSKRSIDKTDGKAPAFIDTYANLLYKSGNQQEAVQWQQKAVDLAQTEDDKATYRDTLMKMQKGEKTWPEGAQ